MRSSLRTAVAALSEWQRCELKLIEAENRLAAAKAFVRRDVRIIDELQRTVAAFRDASDCSYHKAAQALRAHHDARAERDGEHETHWQTLDSAMSSHPS